MMKEKNSTSVQNGKLTFNLFNWRTFIMMPWVSTGQKLLATILGPTSVILITLAVFLVGYAFMYAKNDNVKERCIQVGIGASICGSATTIASLFI